MLRTMPAGCLVPEMRISGRFVGGWVSRRFTGTEASSTPETATAWTGTGGHGKAHGLPPAHGRISRSELAKAIEFPELRAEGLDFNVPGRAGRIIPRTPGQESYMRSMTSNELVFSIGPAGTGKTFLAVAAAVSALQDSRVERIILTRPP